MVIYSAGETHNIDATFLAWLLAGFGHPQVYVLDGGYFKWLLEHRPVDQRYPEITATQFPASRLPAGAGVAGGRRAGDANRRRAAGRRPTAGPVRRRRRARRCAAGTFPGAISHYWQDDLTQAGFGHVWKPLAELREEYAAQGITPDKTIIAYCNSATEASHVHFTLRYLLGYPRVRIYVGSWTEWADESELPVEKGPSHHSGRPAFYLIAIPLRSWPGRQTRPPTITNSTDSRFSMRSSGFLLRSTRSA